MVTHFSVCHRRRPMFVFPPEAASATIDLNQFDRSHVRNGQSLSVLRAVSVPSRSRTAVTAMSSVPCCIRMGQRPRNDDGRTVRPVLMLAFPLSAVRYRRQPSNVRSG